MRVQCEACPWKVSTVPEQDIPGGYCETKHRALTNTIAEEGRIDLGVMRVMACHESPIGAEVPCIGWLENQLGPGNNIALRLMAARGQIEPFQTVGEQHERLGDTFPKRKRPYKPPQVQSKKRGS